MNDDPTRRKTDPDSPPASLRVLIVDDDNDFRVYAGALMRRLGLEVEKVRDGQAALDRLASDPHFDLLLIDYNMPRLDGIELIRAVRANEATASAYAIMMTGRIDNDLKIRALSEGFDDFLEKSTTEIELIAKIVASKRLLLRQQTLDVAVRQLYGLATRDDLTGLFNRRFLFEEGQRLLSRTRDLAVIIFDLDDFKIINDTYGHLVGDRVLRDVGNLFLRTTRYEDLIARYGGDEFVMIVQNMAAADVEKAAARLARDISAMQWTMSSTTFGIRVTAGFAYASMLPGSDLRGLLEVCDHDLYKNKYIRKNPAAEVIPEQPSGDATIVSFPSATPEQKGTKRKGSDEA